MKKTFTLSSFGLLLFALLLTVTACETPADPESALHNEAGATANPDDVLDNEIYTEVDQYPSMLGEPGAFYQEIEYPEIAKKAGIEGRVLVEFIVDEEGHVVNPTVQQGIGGGCDEEAVRALSLARFQPGIHEGKPVKVKMVMPFTFKLPENAG